MENVIIKDKLSMFVPMPKTISQGEIKSKHFVFIPVSVRSALKQGLEDTYHGKNRVRSTNV